MTMNITASNKLSSVLEHGKKQKCRVCGKKATIQTHDKHSEPSKTVYSTVYGIMTSSPQGYATVVFCAFGDQAWVGTTPPFWVCHLGHLMVIHAQYVLLTVVADLKKGGDAQVTAEQYIHQNILQTVKSLSDHTQQFADFPLEKSMSLPSPYIVYIACKICHRIPLAVTTSAHPVSPQKQCLAPVTIVPCHLMIFVLLLWFWPCFYGAHKIVVRL